MAKQPEERKKQEFYLRILQFVIKNGDIFLWFVEHFGACDLVTFTVSKMSRTGDFFIHTVFR